ncbi:hypothetical protein SAY86_000687 [Trapa natans]|uniref:Uncharacterized protein n=1 Tax=Trapa natans TaxID=22666 RepID=A0AAN7MCD8_TRANT|nr:hypothetical protein SAY86_000687 [Trapa natans]
MSSLRVHQRSSKNGKEKIILPCYPKLKDEASTLEPDTIATFDVDWTLSLDDMVIQLFSSLNYQDQASLSSMYKSTSIVDRLAVGALTYNNQRTTKPKLRFSNLQRERMSE